MHDFKRTSYHSLIAALAVFKLCIIFPEYIYSQDSASINSTVILNRARTANEDAQAGYYKLLSKNLNEAPESKSFWQKIEENPASVLGVLGVFVAAMITLLSFVFNYRATLRNQRDTQFYEALKRFGDKDSPPIRSSAAGILSQLAMERRLKARTLQWERPYFKTVLNQLTAGLLLEENHVVLISIRDAIISIATYNPEEVVNVLYQTNVQMQDDMIHSLAEIYVATGTEYSDTYLKLAGSLTGYETEIILTLTERFKEQFSASRDSTSYIDKIIAPEKKEQRFLDAQKSARIIAHRLTATIRVMEKVVWYAIWTHGKLNFIQKIWWKILDMSQGSSLNLASAFLPKIELIGIDVASETTTFKYDPKSGKAISLVRRESISKVLDVFMMGAQLQHARLINSNLDSWQLSAAYLQGANLSNSRLDNTGLYGIFIDAKTNFEGTNWWKANYYKPGDNYWTENRVWDKNLLDELFHRYGTEKIEEAHPSVLDYIKALEKQ